MAQSQKKVDPEGAGRSIDRRDFLKAAGAGGAVATIGASSSSELAPIGNAEAFEVDPCFPIDAVTAGHLLTFAGFGPCDNVLDAINQDPPAVEAYLHGLVVSEYESFGMLYTVLSNRLEDARTMAHIEARHAIASAYEDELTESEAHDEALGAIDEYYSTIKTNIVAAGSKSLLQNGFIAQTVVNDGSIQDTFLVPNIPDNYGGSGSPVAGAQRLRGDYEDVEFTLYSEGSVAMAFPQYYYEFDNGDTYSRAPTEGEWNSYDGANDQFTLSGPNGDIVTDLETNVANVPIEGGDDLPGHTGFRADDFAALLDQVDSEWSQVRNQYPQSFVTELYGLLDNTDLSPSQIRGIDGMATHLAGTSDATSSAYRLALQMMLGMEQADLRNVSHQEVTISAATGITVQEINGQRTRFSSDYVTGEVTEGLLFARGVPNSTLVTGDTYVLDGYGISRNGTIHDMAGNTAFDIGIPSSQGLTWLPEEELVISFEGTDVRAYNIWDGEEIWTRSGDGPVARLTGANDGVMVDGSNIVQVDLGSGATVETAPTSSALDGPLVVGSDESTAYVSHGSDVVAYNLWDGAELWRTSLSGSVRSIDISTDGETVVAGVRSAVYKIDSSDGSEIGSVSTGYKSDNLDIDIAVGGDSIFVLWTGYNDTAGSPEYYNDLVSYDLETLSENWHKDTEVSPTNHDIYGIDADIDGEYISVGSGGFSGIFDGLNGNSIGGSNGGFITTSRRSAAWPVPDARLDSAYFFDAAEGRELTLADGYITIDSQQDSEGNEVDETTYDTPAYDENDTEAFEEYIIRLEEAAENLQQDATWDLNVDLGGIADDIAGWFDDLLPGWPLSFVETIIAAVAVYAGVNILGDSS